MSDNSLLCGGCGSQFTTRNGIIDLLANPDREVITPFQAIMQARPVVFIYEKAWRRAGYFLASSRGFEREIAGILNMARQAPTGMALDLACGPGIFTRPLATATREAVVGLDLSLPMLRRARILIDRTAISNVTFVRGSAFQIPFVDGAFALVNCCGALHLFDNPGRALSEVRRVMRPGGLFTAQTIIRPKGPARLAGILERHIRFGFFDERELKNLLNSHGFEIKAGERHGISCTFLAR